MGKPLLYQFGISPTCQRVFATLAHKGIEYDTFEVDISQKQRPEEFNKVSPYGKVPLLVHDGHRIVESINIITYVDEVWPTPPMLPADAAGRAYARQWLIFADREILDKDAQFTHVERDLDRKREICHGLFAGLSALESELADKTGLFLGRDLSLVDCALDPTMAFLPVWSRIVDDRCYGDYRHIRAYTDRLRAHPTLAATVFNIPEDVYQGFFEAVLGQGLTVP